VSRRADALWRVAMRAAYRAQLAWWFVRRPAIQGAHVAVWHGGRVLAIRNSYRRHLTLPAGRIAWRETSRDAAARELAEEVGIRVAPEHLAYHGEIVVRSSYAEDHAHVFELHCGERPAFAVDRREVVWAEFLEPADALARGVSGVVRRYLEDVGAAPGRGAATDAPGRA